MNFLEIIYEYPPVGGGGGVITKQVLSSVVKQGHTVDVVTMGNTGVASFEKQQGIRIFRTYSGRNDLSRCGIMQTILFIFTGTFQAIRLCRQNNYEFIHATFIMPSGIIGYFVSKLFGKKLIISAHGSDVPGHNQKLSTLHIILRPFWKKIVRSATKTTTVSEHMKSLMNKEQPAEIIVIPNGIDTEKFSPTSYAKKILCVGRLQEFKGIQYSLKAMQDLNLGDYELLVVGDGPYRAELEQIAKNYNINAKFLGRIPFKDMIEIYKSSSILISASLFESLSNVVMEAMACGLAVIASDAGGCPSLVGNAGIIVPKKDPRAIRQALVSLLDNPEKIKAYGQQARTRIINEFSIEKIANSYINLFRDTIEK